ncbi:MAG: pyridoxamine 5-phosphate oxidase, partial [Solirubrobacterales bacterium]|nr:pyridoxamine 5-phosphate oxidase [Solirubrobacterales bacterium]
RYAPSGSGDLAPEVEAMVRKQAEKRLDFEFVEQRRATWDHRKLGGVY